MSEKKVSSVFTQQFSFDKTKPQYLLTRQINQCIQDGMFSADNVISIVHGEHTVTLYYRG